MLQQSYMHSSAYYNSLTTLTKSIVGYTVEFKFKNQLSSIHRLINRLSIAGDKITIEMHTKCSDFSVNAICGRNKNAIMLQLYDSCIAQEDRVSLIKIKSTCVAHINKYVYGEDIETNCIPIRFWAWVDNQAVLKELNEIKELVSTKAVTYVCPEGHDTWKHYTEILN